MNYPFPSNYVFVQYYADRNFQDNYFSKRLSILANIQIFYFHKFSIINICEKNTKYLSLYFSVSKENRHNTTNSVWLNCVYPESFNRICNWKIKCRRFHKVPNSKKYIYQQNIQFFQFKKSNTCIYLNLKVACMFSGCSGIL